MGVSISDKADYLCILRYSNRDSIVDNSPEVVDTYGFLNSSIPIIFSHATFITPIGLNLLRQHNQYICTTPESEMGAGLTHPHTDLFLDQAALGVDSHFGWPADPMTQARLLLADIRQTRYR